MSSHAHESIPDDVSTSTSSDTSQSLVPDLKGLDAAPDRRRLCVALISAYNGDTYRLLTDLADLLEASVAYVDRLTVEAHMERPLSDTDWSAVASTFTAMAFDEHIGNAGTVRTDWIDDMLLRAASRQRRRGDSDSSRSLGQSPRP